MGGGPEFATEDAWVPRSEKVWRHGKWNQETPYNLLEEAGFVTPNELYFIRSHGPVPVKPEGAQSGPRGTPTVTDAQCAALDKRMQTEHTLEIGGEFATKPTTFTLADLKNPKKFKQVELWSCLVCSGQRRLELNLIKKGAGHIDWHNAVGNAKWKGVYLRDVLLACGVDERGGAQHVEFYGKDDYQTSIPFAKCMDLSGDTLLAYEMNGEALPFDHGYPLRVVVPGWSSKCSAKWLWKVTVQKQETEARM